MRSGNGFVADPLFCGLTVSYRNFDTFFFLKSFYTIASNFDIEAKRNAFYGLVLKIDSKLRDSKKCDTLFLEFLGHFYLEIKRFLSKTHGPKAVTRTGRPSARSSYGLTGRARLRGTMQNEYTNQPTDGPTKKATYRVASTLLKIWSLLLF